MLGLLLGLCAWWLGRGWRLPGAALAALCWFLLQAQASLALRIDPGLEGRLLRIEGRVVGLPERDPERERFEFVVAHAVKDDTTVEIGGTLRLAIYRDPVPVHAGQTLALEVRLRRPRGLRNPDGFDFERLALERRYAATGHVTRVLRRDPEPRGIDAERAAVSRWIASMTANRAAASLLRALAVGDQGAIPDPMWETFRATGTTHLVAISGFHIGLVASAGAALGALLHWLLPGLGLHVARRPAAAAFGLLAAVGYSLLAGFSLPVQRTLAMIVVVLLAVVLRRRISAGGSLALAVIVVLAFDPLAVLNPGFWLSFGGVFWLLFALGGRSGERWWRSYTRAQWVAFVALLPLGIAWFQQTSLVGPAVNFVAIPWVSFVLVPLLLLALAIEPLAAGVAAAILHIAAYGAEIYLNGLDIAAALPVAQWQWPAPSRLALALAMLGVAILLLPRAVAARSLGLAMLLPLLLPRFDRPPPGAFDLSMLDVGQGLAIIVRTHRHTLLYDAGPSHPAGIDTGQAIVAPALRAMGVSRLDAMIISHGDNDHAGGARAILRSHRPAQVLSGPGTGLGAACVSGQRWTWDGVQFELLHPPAHFPALRNDASCVLRIATGGGSALLPGDISSTVEQRLLRDGAPLAAGLLALPHHGSRSSSSAAFLAAVRPTIALVSAAHRSRFGHPNPEVVARAEALNAQVLGTAEHGALRFRIDPAGGIRLLQTSRGDRQHLWQEREP
jgi:competence protein ComEC